MYKYANAILCAIIFLCCDMLCALMFCFASAYRNFVNRWQHLQQLRRRFDLDRLNAADTHTLTHRGENKP